LQDEWSKNHAFEADYYIIAELIHLLSLVAGSQHLEAMHAIAKAQAIFEVTSLEDKQT